MDRAEWQRDAALELELKKEFFWRAFKALHFNGIDGDYVEFGCHNGTTFSLAFAEIRRRDMDATLWAFDSFQGLPQSNRREDRHPRWQAGHMATSIERFREICADNGIPDVRYRAVEGYYSDTLDAGNDTALPSNICMAYIDCDMYSSTLSVCEFLEKRLKHGMIIALDDYYCWSPDELPGEKRAWEECFGNHGRWSFAQFGQIGWAGASFVVEDKALWQATGHDRAA